MAKYHKKKIQPRKNKPRVRRTIKNDTKSLWKQRFLERVRQHHKRNIDKIVAKLLKKATNVLVAMRLRSKKHGVKFEMTAEEVNGMLCEAYGTKCKYCDKKLTYQNMVFDHIIPISVGGMSTRDNLQIICKTSNSIKGSLSEEEFYKLLDWLGTQSETLRRNVLIRLARGFI